jgi:hypothetical protein
MSNTTDVSPRIQLPRNTISLSSKVLICNEASVQISCSGTGIRSLARKYNVQPSQIRRWMKAFATLYRCFIGKLAFGMWI